MKTKKQFPKLVNTNFKDSLERVSEFMVNSYKETVFPTLYKFNLLEDTHIKKYLESETWESIYRDALDESKDIVSALEIQALLSDVDIWKEFRDTASPVKSPKEDGFIFAKLPHSDYKYKWIILKALTVKDCHIFIDKGVFYEAAIINPSERTQELYELLADFCDKLEEKNFKKLHINELLTYDANGKLCPYVRGIARIWCEVID